HFLAVRMRREDEDVPLLAGVVALAVRRRGAAPRAQDRLGDERARALLAVTLEHLALAAAQVPVAVGVGCAEVAGADPFVRGEAVEAAVVEEGDGAVGAAELQFTVVRGAELDAVDRRADVRRLVCR